MSFAAEPRTLIKPPDGLTLPSRDILTPHQVFGEMAAANKSFDRFYNDSWDHREITPPVIDAKAEQSVDAYIAAMQKYKASLTEADVLNENVNLGGNLDPVLIPIWRAMKGNMSPELWRKFRSQWCGWDLPGNMEDILRAQHDRDFIEQYQRYPFEPDGHFKMRALQRMGTTGKTGVAKLVEARLNK